MKRILVLIICMVSFDVSATIYCSGKVRNIYINKSGDLIVRGSWRGDYTRFCNVNGTVDNVKATTCALWASYAATALKDKIKVYISYPDSAGTCTTLAAYGNAVSPIYFMLSEESVN